MRGSIICIPPRHIKGLNKSIDLVTHQKSSVTARQLASLVETIVYMGGLGLCIEIL